MPVLHLEDVPEELYGRIEQLAAAAQVPLHEETLQLLHQVVDMRSASARTDVLQLLQEIRRNPIVPVAGTPDGIEMLREDRSR